VLIVTFDPAFIRRQTERMIASRGARSPQRAVIAAF
jgi:hypothetical protein